MNTLSTIHFSSSGRTAKMAEAMAQGARSVAGTKSELIEINVSRDSTRYAIALGQRDGVGGAW